MVDRAALVLDGSDRRLGVELCVTRERYGCNQNGVYSNQLCFSHLASRPYVVRYRVYPQPAWMCYQIVLPVAAARLNALIILACGCGLNYDR